MLRRKGNPNACTLHKLLYDSFPLPNGGFRRVPKIILDYSIIVVDEISMVPKSMIDLLLRHKNIYVIFLGDPFQLPQINKEEENHLLEKPNIFLDEVMRQAEESEIIRLTMKIRNKEFISFEKGKEVQILNSSELNFGMLDWADQILVATNKTRHSINQQMRHFYGFEGMPQEGEKIICKRNYWDTVLPDSALVNGTTGIISKVRNQSIFYPYPASRKIENIIADFQPFGGENVFSDLIMDKQYLNSESCCFSNEENYKLSKKCKEILPKQFTYAYAITVHSAQGSEWDKVVVLEEKFPYETIEHARWAYTACTRASEKLVIVKD